MGCADGLDALAARARVLWVPVHLGGGVVRKPCERLCAFLETDRMGFGDTLPHATTLPSDLMGSGDKRHGCGAHGKVPFSVREGASATSVAPVMYT